MQYRAVTGLNYPVKGQEIRVEAGAILTDVVSQAKGDVKYIPAASAKVYLQTGDLQTGTDEATPAAEPVDGEG